MGQTITGALANIPFPFGIDPNTGEYGYYKAGADSVVPFKNGGSTLIYIGSGTTSINVSSKVPDYASATSNNFIIMPTSGTSTTGSRTADQPVTVYIDKSGPSYNSSTGALSYSIRARAQQGSYLLTTTGYIPWNAYYTSVPITELA